MTYTISRYTDNRKEEGWNHIWYHQATIDQERIANKIGTEMESEFLFGAIVRASSWSFPDGIFKNYGILGPSGLLYNLENEDS